MSNERKHRSPEEKVAILRRHLIDKVPVCNLREEYGLHPTVFYRWLKQFFANGAAAFGPAPRADKQVEAREQRIAFLEGKLKKKDEVLAELMEEDGALKKVLRRSEEPMGAPRHTRPSDRFRAPLERAGRDRHPEVCPLVGVASSKFYDWRARYGQVNEHNGWVPRDFWLETWEKRAIFNFYDRLPLEG